MKQTKCHKLMTLFLFTFIFLAAGENFAKADATTDFNRLKYSVGVIDRIGSDEIVIDDSLYRYEKEIIFLSRSGTKIALKWFKTGKKVKFYLSKNNRVLVLRLP